MSDLPPIKPTLHTERLRLRPVRESDAALLADLDRPEPVRRYVLQPFVPTPEHFLEKVIPRWRELDRNDHRTGFWMAEDAAAPEGEGFIGWFHLRPPLDDTPSRPGDLELGYRIRLDAWGRGYATEGSRRLLAHGFETIEAPRVIAGALAENAASIRVMTKLGLTHDSDCVFGGVPSVVYAIARETWRSGGDGDD